MFKGMELCERKVDEGEIKTEKCVAGGAGMRPYGRQCRRAENLSMTAYVKALLASVSKSDQLVVMDDFNARVGRDVTTWGGVIGRYGEKVKNRNGQKLLGLCATNELVGLSTIYQHKDIYKYTWESKGRGSDPSLSIL